MSFIEFLEQLFKPKIDKEIYDDVIKERDDLLEKVSLLNKDLNNLSDELSSVEFKYEEAKLQLKEALKKKEPINILDYKDYYENKKEKRAWLYPWKGDGKELDTKYALSLSKTQQEVIDEAAKTLINKYSLDKNTTPEKVIEKVVSYFRLRSNWRYLKDEKNSAQGKRKDYWANAATSWKTRVGDCEDLAILMHNLIYSLFNLLGLEDHYWRLEFSAWILTGSEGGHAQNTWLGEDGEWYVIESTYDLNGSFSRTWLKTPIKYNNLYSKPMGWARRDKSWRGSMSSLANMTQEVTINGN